MRIRFTKEKKSDSFDILVLKVSTADGLSACFNVRRKTEVWASLRYHPLTRHQPPHPYDLLSP